MRKLFTSNRAVSLKLSQPSSLGWNHSGYCEPCPPGLDRVPQLSPLAGQHQPTQVPEGLTVHALQVPEGLTVHALRFWAPSPTRLTC